MCCSESCCMNMCFRAERAGFFDTLLFALTTLRADRACSSITNPNIAARRGSLRRNLHVFFDSVSSSPESWGSWQINISSSGSSHCLHFPSEPIGPLMKAIHHHCGMTCLRWPVCTSTLTSRVWRGCLPRTPQNHDLMPLIYTVSRAYQKVSSGALRRVHTGLVGTLFPSIPPVLHSHPEFWRPQQRLQVMLV